MKRHIFTPEERAELESNPNIKKVMKSNVEYTKEFKRRALRVHEEKGKPGKQIFAEAKIPDWFNRGKYAKYAIIRWKRQQKLRKNTRGRPKKQISKPILDV